MNFLANLPEAQQRPALYGSIIGVFTAVKAFLLMYCPEESKIYAWDPALEALNETPAFAQAWFAGGVGFAVASTSPNFRYHAMAMLVACAYAIRLHLEGDDPFSEATLINVLYYPYGIAAANIYFAFFHDYGDAAAAPAKSKSAAAPAKPKSSSKAKSSSSSSPLNPPPLTTQPWWKKSLTSVRSSLKKKN